MTTKYDFDNRVVELWRPDFVTNRGDLRLLQKATGKKDRVSFFPLCLCVSVVPFFVMRCNRLVFIQRELGPFNRG